MWCSFEALRVKLLLAPKKQGVVTSYRSIKRKKQQVPALGRFTLGKTDLDDEYETTQVQERRIVTFGVDIAKLADWLDEEMTGQEKLPVLITHTV